MDATRNIVSLWRWLHQPQFCLSTLKLAALKEGKLWSSKKEKGIFA